MTVQFDTGSAIVYVLTDKCNENCNTIPKYKTGFVQQAESATSFQFESDDMNNRIEYGYGSGYINGNIADQKICFAEGKTAPCVSGVNVLMADQATGVSQDRFAGIIGLSPRSTEP